MNHNEFDFDGREASEEASTVEAGVPKDFRRLHWHEPVLNGDYVIDAQRGFELWEGPSGFRADSFVKPIYRRGKIQAAKKLQNHE